MVNMGSWFISTLEAYMKDAETKFNWGIVKYPHLPVPRQALRWVL